MTISRIRLVAILGVLLLILTACASGSTDTTEAATTTADEPTTTAVSEETSDPGSVSGLGDMPAECVAAFRTYLRAIEPIVEDFDFETATMEEFGTLNEQFEEVSGTFEADTSSCPTLDMTDEESFAAMIDFAEDEAPGTVGYFEALRDFVATSSSGGTVEGDCESNIAAVQELVDQGGTMNDLTTSEFATVGALLGAISATCSPERANEFLTIDEMSAWLIGG